MWIKIKDIDIYTGMREAEAEIIGPNVPADQRRASVQAMQAQKKKRGVKGYVVEAVRNIF